MPAAKPAKAFDADGGVDGCGSFTKTLAPACAWLGGCWRWRDRVATLKRVHGDSTNIVLEHAWPICSPRVATKPCCACLSDRCAVPAEARRLIAASFPRGTRVSNPPAGYTLWIELLPDVGQRCSCTGCVPSRALPSGRGRCSRPPTALAPVCG